jgi:hypothetical protein
MPRSAGVLFLQKAAARAGVVSFSIQGDENRVSMMWISVD